MNKRLKFGIVIIVLVLAIGFAAVATNIIVNGNAQLGFKSSDYDIYFSSAIPEDDGTATIDSVTKKTITYSTKTLTSVGDQAILDYIVTNASTQYDARCTVEFEIDDGASEYVTITKTGFSEDTPTIVNAQSNKSGRVLITLKKRSMEAIQIHFTITLNFEPVGKTEPGEEGNVTGSDEEPDEEECIPSAYYGIQCSCDDSTYISWNGGPYLDTNNIAMNSTRKRDINYPPANTFACECSNGDSGYVVNTGELLEGVCPALEPDYLDADQKLFVRVDNRPAHFGYYWNVDEAIHHLTIPAYDDETGTIPRSQITVDIYNHVDDTILEVIEVDQWAPHPVIENSERVEFVSLKKNRYRYIFHLDDAVGDSLYFQVILRNKDDNSIIYSSNDYISISNVDYGSYRDEYDESLYYGAGEKAWATWFMNKGRTTYCDDLYSCRE